MCMQVQLICCNPLLLQAIDHVVLKKPTPMDCEDGLYSCLEWLVRRHLETSIKYSFQQSKLYYLYRSLNMLILDTIKTRTTQRQMDFSFLQSFGDSRHHIDTHPFTFLLIAAYTIGRISFMFFCVGTRRALETNKRKLLVGLQQ